MCVETRHKLRLYKKEKLCSVTAIDALFAVRHKGETATEGAAIAYPLRMVWRVNTARSVPAGIQFLISVPKKKLRHAVDRVTMRRRIREAYRLNRHLIPLPEHVAALDTAFVYVADRIVDSAHVHAAMTKLLHKAAEAIAPATTADNGNEA